MLGHQKYFVPINAILRKVQVSIGFLIGANQQQLYMQVIMNKDTWTGKSLVWVFKNDIK